MRMIQELIESVKYWFAKRKRMKELKERDPYIYEE